MQTIRIVSFAVAALILWLGTAAMPQAKNGSSPHDLYSGQIVTVDPQAKTIAVKSLDGLTQTFSIGPQTKIEKETHRLGIAVHSLLPGAFADLSTGTNVKIVPAAGSGIMLPAKAIVISAGP